MLNSYLIPCNHCLISARYLKGWRVPRCLGAKCQSLHILISTFYMLASVTINSLNHLFAQLPFRNHKSECHLWRAFIWCHVLIYACVDTYRYMFMYVHLEDLFPYLCTMQKWWRYLNCIKEATKLGKGERAEKGKRS